VVNKPFLLNVLSPCIDSCDRLLSAVSLKSLSKHLSFISSHVAVSCELTFMVKKNSVA
jgi:hypothetical protein